MRYHLLSSAMMPSEGIYVCYRVSRELFCHELMAAHQDGLLCNYISYPQNLALLREWTGIDLPASRQETVVEDGDVLLAMRLRYRPDVNMKSDRTRQMALSENDFDFFVTKFSKLPSPDKTR